MFLGKILIFFLRGGISGVFWHVEVAGWRGWRGWMGGRRKIWGRATSRTVEREAGGEAGRSREGRREGRACIYIIRYREEEDKKEKPEVTKNDKTHNFMET